MFIKFELINFSSKVNVLNLLSMQTGGTLEKGNQASFITQSLVLTKRSFVNMYRDLGYYWLPFAIYVALGLCIGTIFHDIGSSYGSIQVTLVKAQNRTCTIVQFNEIFT